MTGKYLQDDVELKRGSVDEAGASRYHNREQNVPDGYVSDLQNDLVELGYTEVGTPDGYFGARTEKAVRALQQDEGVTDDGVVGSVTKGLIKTRIQQREAPDFGLPDTHAIPWDRFPENASPMDKVSEHFCLYELTKSSTATRRGIDNGFASVDELRCAVYLCREIMEPVRERFGAFSPNSVYRSQALERVLKKQPDNWVSRSQHTAGQACDIEVHAASNMELAEWVRDNLEFDQLIIECYSVSGGPNSGWVHVSVCPPGIGENRHQVLSYVKNQVTGKYQYVNGLVEEPG